MKWFKHDSDASSDAKIKKLLIRYGAVGYAVYFHCLELIAGNVSNDNITFELEHDSEIIADNLRIRGTNDKSGMQIVEDIMRYIIDLKLFENHDGRITCFKMIKRLDSSMTSNAAFRKMILDAKENHDFMKENHDSDLNNHDGVMIKGQKVMQEENRIEEKRIYNPPYPPAGGNVDSKTSEKPAKPKKQFLTQAEAGLLIDSRPEISVEFSKMLKTFVRNRREIKKPMTQLALEQTINLLFKKLDTDTERIDCIQLSIANGWRGIFPERMAQKRFAKPDKPSQSNLGNESRWNDYYAQEGRDAKQG